MSIDDGAESGESSYRTTMPAPEAISFRSPDVLEQEHDDEDEDDDSIILIEPCKNFKKYSSWLKFTFPFLIKKRHINLIDNVLKIHDWESLFKYYYYGPKQWVDLLGKVEYLKHYKFLIELNCIWTVTINEKDAIDWELYMESKYDRYHDVEAIYKKEADLLFESDVLDLQPSVPVVPVKTPDVVQMKTSKYLSSVKTPSEIPLKTSKMLVPMKTPVHTSSMDPPPVYSKVSPVVKAPSIAYAPRASSKRKQGSVKSYKTTSPNLPVTSSMSLPSLVHAK